MLRFYDGRALFVSAAVYSSNPRHPTVFLPSSFFMSRVCFFLDNSSISPISNHVKNRASIHGMGSPQYQVPITVLRARRYKIPTLGKIKWNFGLIRQPSAKLGTCKRLNEGQSLKSESLILKRTPRGRTLATEKKNQTTNTPQEEDDKANDD